jgi:diguanylate cyclase (GGDEF)-like protein
MSNCPESSGGDNHQPGLEIKLDREVGVETGALELIEELHQKIKYLEAENVGLRVEKVSLQAVIDNLREDNKQLEEDSLKDRQTKCLNRNYYEQYKEENFDPERDNGKLALVFIDIDNLKAINDSYGHLIGDRLIEYVANFLKKSGLRKSDVVIRWGGDEFLIVCHNDENDEEFENNLNDRLEALRKKLEEGIYLEKEGLILKASFSFGVAVYRKGLDSGLVGTEARADKNMYKDKKENRSIMRGAGLRWSDIARIACAGSRPPDTD